MTTDQQRWLTAVRQTTLGSKLLTPGGRCRYETFTACEKEHCLSSGEALMAKFFISVRFGRAPTDCLMDVTDLAAVLDKENNKIVTDWITNPYWP